MNSLNCWLVTSLRAMKKAGNILPEIARSARGPTVDEHRDVRSRHEHHVVGRAAVSDERQRNRGDVAPSQELVGRLAHDRRSWIRDREVPGAKTGLRQLDPQGASRGVDRLLDRRDAGLYPRAFGIRVTLEVHRGARLGDERPHRQHDLPPRVPKRGVALQAPVLHERQRQLKRFAVLIALSESEDLRHGSILLRSPAVRADPNPRRCCGDRGDGEHGGRGGNLPACRDAAGRFFGLAESAGRRPGFERRESISDSRNSVDGERSVRLRDAAQARDAALNRIVLKRPGRPSTGR